ncbi:MAG: hypothetical protein NC328_02615 [Muribaculum sp.]|nr:hypothetical protein [Muribaculum sp.]
MKQKVLLMMMALTGLFALSACSDDNDLPDVNITVQMQEVSEYNGIIYVVQGKEFQVNSITVTSLNGKNSALTTVEYYMDHYLTAVTNVSPYTCTFNTNSLPVGNHLLQMRSNVLQVDKSLATVWLNYYVTVVASEKDLPEGAPALGVINDQMQGQQKAD